MQIMSGVDNPVGMLQAGLTAEPGAGGRNDLMVISFESPNPIEAAQVVNTIVERYITFTAKQRKNSAAEVLKLLTTEKDKQDKKLKENLDAALAFKRDNGVLSFQSDRGNIILQTLGKLSDALTATQMERIDAQADFDALQRVRNDPARILELARTRQLPKEMSINIEQQQQAQASNRRESGIEQELGVLKGEIARLERQKFLMQETYTPSHKAWIDLERELGYVKEKADAKAKELAAERASTPDPEVKTAEQRREQESAKRVTQDEQVRHTYVAQIEYRLAMVTQREAQLEKAFNVQKQQAFALNSTAAQYQMLDTELQRVQKLCDIIDTRIKELNVTEDTGTLNVNVLEVARPAAFADKPNKPRVLAMGVVLGLMLGIGLALGLDFMDQRIRSVEEVAAIVDAPVLGLVPHISARETLSRRGQQVALDPTSDVAEAYRTIRTAVFFGVRGADGERKANRLLVTSPAPGDGKTTSTSNLAIAMASAGHRVILIDADLRRPTQHKVFQLNAETGVSTVMDGSATLDQSIRHTGVDNLDLLPAGPLPANPSEILNSQAFADMIDELSERYDHVLIDSPPVAPVTDARILGAMCDGTILVLRAEKSTRKLSEHARDSLLGVGTHILGVIVNDVPRRRDRYGYYYGYGYGYRHRQYGYAAAAAVAATPINGNGNGNGHVTGNGHANGNGHSNGNGNGKRAVAGTGHSEEVNA